MKKILQFLRKRTPAAQAVAHDQQKRRELSSRDVLWESLVANRINAGR